MPATTTTPKLLSAASQTPHIQVRDRGLTSQGVMDKNESALVIIKIVTKLVSPYIVLSQEYYSRIFDPRKEVL